MIIDALTNGVQELAVNKPSPLFMRSLNISPWRRVNGSNGLADTNQTVYRQLNASAWSACPNMQGFYSGQLCKPL